MSKGQAPAWPIFLNAGIAGLLLGFGVPVAGIAAWTLLTDPNDAIAGALALALLPYGIAPTIFGMLWLYGVWGWIRARGPVPRRQLLINGGLSLAVGIAAPIAFLALLVTRVS